MTHLIKLFGVTDGIRTRDNQIHKLALYQLNYGHHKMVPGAGIEPARYQIAQDFKSCASTYSATQALISRFRFQQNNSTIFFNKSQQVFYFFIKKILLQLFSTYDTIE